MLEKIKRWLNPPETPGEFTDADENALDHDNQRYAANREAIERAKDRPRYRFRFWFFFF